MMYVMFVYYKGFSALQRAEIAEIDERVCPICGALRFSALQRAEIAEIVYPTDDPRPRARFQCSSTSRNC